jgi:hypothetical protein
MVRIYRHALLDGSGMVGFSNGAWTAAQPAEAAIRSLRVKLFRERADLWDMRSLSVLCRTVDGMERCIRRSQRFSAIADAIERGEK